MNSVRTVAEKAGVCSCTVSKVLSGVSSCITGATRDRVLLAAHELNHQPNRYAVGLGERRTQTIGLLVSGLQNPFFVSMAEEAERQFLAAGYQVVLDAAPPLGEYYGHVAGGGGSLVTNTRRAKVGGRWQDVERNRAKKRARRTGDEFRQRQR